MIEYTIKVDLLTDTLLGSGQSVPGIIDTDVKYDEYGIPYMEAKTLKGHIGEQMRWLVQIVPEMKGVHVDELLGSSDQDGDKKSGKLHFSVLKLQKGIETRLKSAIDEKVFTKNELLESLTTMYVYTGLDENGIADDHTLRKARMIVKGLEFEAVIHTDELTEEEEKLFVMSVLAMQHIGTYKSKGKGLIATSVYKKEVADWINLGEKYNLQKGDR